MDNLKRLLRNFLIALFAGVVFTTLFMVLDSKSSKNITNKNLQTSTRQKLSQTPTPVISVAQTSALILSQQQKNNSQTIDWSNILPTLQQQLRDKLQKTTPIVMPTIVIPTQKPLSFSCSAEGQEKINAYNAQIKQEYDVCAADANAKVQQMFTICGSDNDCIMKISQGPNNCTLSYQSKQKEVINLMSQYCGMR